VTLHMPLLGVASIHRESERDCPKRLVERVA
jgi:hypothetical protein